MDNLHLTRFTLDRIDARIPTEFQQDATIPIAVLADRAGLMVPVGVEALATPPNGAPAFRPRSKPCPRPHVGIRDGSGA